MEHAANNLGTYSSHDYSWSFSEIACYEGPKKHFSKCSEHFNNLKENFTLCESLSCLGEFFITLIDAVPVLGHIAFVIEMIAARCFGEDDKVLKVTPKIPETDIIEHAQPSKKVTSKQKRLAVKKNKEYLCVATLALAAMNYNLSEFSRQRVADLKLKVLSPSSCLSDPNSISDTLNLSEYNFIDPATGLKMLIATNKTNAFICFGTIQDTEEEDIYENYEGDCLATTVLKNGARTLFQETAELYDEAERLVDGILEGDALKGKKITVIGHCLNGSVATVVGLRKGWAVQTINSLPLGEKLQNRIGEENLANADRLVTHISVEGDCMDSPYYFGIINFVSRLFCLGTSSKPGQHITIPAHQDFAQLSYADKMHAIHNKFLKSISAHCNNETAV